MDEQSKKKNPKDEYPAGEGSQEHFPEDPGLDPGHAPQPQPSNIEHQTTGMETHAHHLHKASGRGWKHYLYEFLMLFLAVTAGFFVENLREHYIEHKRANQYAASLVSDLAQDTVDLVRANERYSFSANNIDTFLMLMIHDDVQHIPTGKLYWYGLWSGYNRSFVQNDATFLQMKNSGSLRYITNKTINKKLGQYDALVRKIEKQNTEDLPFQLKTRELRARLFNFKYNNAVNRLILDSADLKDYPRIDSFMKTNPPLISSDPVLFNQFAEFCRVRTRIFQILLRYQQQAMQLAKELITDLKNEYRLE